LKLHSTIALTLSAGLLAGAVATLWPCGSVAAVKAAKINVLVDCKCSDAVGQSLCAGFKKKVQDSVGYQLANNNSGFGMGVHFSCVDLWQGITGQLAGKMSAVSVAFTVYSDKLPGEVFEDSSVFRVGKDAVPEMSTNILGAVGQIVNVNSKLFDQIRTANEQPAPSGEQAAPPGEQPSPSP
jgi:hypothetical protein